MVSLDSLFLLAKKGFTSEPSANQIFHPYKLAFPLNLTFSFSVPHLPKIPRLFSKILFPTLLVFHLYDNRKVLTSFLECTMYFFHATLFTLKPHIFLPRPHTKKHLYTLRSFISSLYSSLS